MEKLQKASILLPSGRPSPVVASFRNGASGDNRHHFIFNHLMTHSKKSATILYIFRDLGHLFSDVNIATALNQFAKIMGFEVGGPPARSL